MEAFMLQEEIKQLANKIYAGVIKNRRHLQR